MGCNQIQGTKTSFLMEFQTTKYTANSRSDARHAKSGRACGLYRKCMEAARILGGTSCPEPALGAARFCAHCVFRHGMDGLQYIYIYMYMCVCQLGWNGMEQRGSSCTGQCWLLDIQMLRNFWVWMILSAGLTGFHCLQDLISFRGVIHQKLCDAQRPEGPAVRPGRQSRQGETSFGSCIFLILYADLKESLISQQETVIEPAGEHLLT